MFLWIVLPLSCCPPRSPIRTFYMCRTTQDRIMISRTLPPTTSHLLPNHMRATRRFVSRVCMCFRNLNDRKKTTDHDDKKNSATVATAAADLPRTTADDDKPPMTSLILSTVPLVNLRRSRQPLLGRAPAAAEAGKKVVYAAGEGVTIDGALPATRLT